MIEYLYYDGAEQAPPIIKIVSKLRPSVPSKSAGSLLEPVGGIRPRCVELIMKTVVLLLISNIFMTLAWYGHLKYVKAPLFTVIIVSWLIAFAEYCFQVPANRIGYREFSAVQLKTIQEVVSLSVFTVFSVLYLGERLKWNYLAGFALIVAAVYLIFKK